ncbi:hypothetical protein EHI44_16865 [Rhizobium leguminosarum]|uniref:hypothetical protein n=1 Tax=Rhizobium leguminosarum TaxID=384 RepID=UPI000FF346AC|nr:hypothetical protein [Rhizobium leguminosarum]RWY85185.1 hypothetical protein EHI44_16865 [Rhizobium leguminosarum]
MADPVYKHAVNEARGEARLIIDGVELVLAAEMGRLSAVSSRLQCKSLNDLFMRLSGVEAAATLAGIELLTVKGSALEAITKIKLKHFPACAAAFSTILAHHFDGDEGNAEAVDETA